MSRKRMKICVVTGSRAEYGLLYPLLRKITQDPSLQLQLAVTGMHLSPQFGNTYRQIEEDGFEINEKIPMLLSGDSDASMTKSTGLGLIGFADAYERLQPDWVVLLGDRFETFAAAVGAHLAKIPIAHLHGGEITEGATDDALRHAISKMSYLHFTSAAVYKKRLEQLGESPGRVFHTGAIGIDNIKTLKLLSRKDLERQLGIKLSDKLAVVTYHPVTLDRRQAGRQVRELLSALDKAGELQLVITRPNADANNHDIVTLMDEYAARHPDRVSVFTSLGQLRYLSLLQYASVVVGNSSSGIIEAPYFRIPTVNIGDRQAGRIRAASVIDVAADRKAIAQGISKALSPDFIRSFMHQPNPYGSGNVAGKICSILKRTGIPRTVKKSFYDLL